MASAAADTSTIAGRQFRRLTARATKVREPPSGSVWSVNTTVIELEDVSLGYDGVSVLDHVSFVIRRGEFMALVGPNGAGKTTLLRGMLGLISALAGRIKYDFDRAATPPGYVPQRESLDPIFPLSVYEVVLMGTYAKLSPWQRVGRQQRSLAQQCLAAANTDR